MTTKLPPEIEARVDEMRMTTDEGRCVHIDDVRTLLCDVLAKVWHDLAHEMNREWVDSVLHRPDENIYRAGMDKTLRMLENRFLDRAAEARGEREDPQPMNSPRISRERTPEGGGE